MFDEYWDAVGEQWGNILMIYKRFEDKLMSQEVPLRKLGDELAHCINKNRKAYIPLDIYVIILQGIKSWQGKNREGRPQCACGDQDLRNPQGDRVWS